MMNAKFVKMFILALGLTISVSVESATLEWELLRSLKLDAAPQDVAISPDGKSVYILTHNGDIQVYDLDGRLKDKIEIREPVDQIRLGPSGDQLFVTDRQNKTVKVIQLDFIQEITINGSPSKGFEDAPIIIADFSDFE